jgi:O-antigen/teichoic acid export membrane protein
VTVADPEKVALAAEASPGTAEESPGPAEAAGGPMRRVWMQIVHTSGARIYSLIGGLVILTITARWLGPSGRGQVAASLVWANVFYLTGFLSLNYVAIHEAAANPEDRRWLAPTMGTLFAFDAFVSVVGWIVAAILWFATSGQIYGAIPTRVLIIGLAIVPFYILEQYANGILIALGRLDIYNRAMIVMKTIVLLLVGIFCYLHFGVASAITTTLVGQIGMAVAGMPHAYRVAGSRMEFDFARLKRLIARGMKLHPSNVAMYLSGYSSVLLINHYLSAAQTGVYHFAMQLVEVMFVIPIAANLVLFSKTTEVGVIEAWPFHRRVLGGVMLVMTFGCIAAAILAPIGIPLLAGKAFTPSVPIFRWLLIAVWIGSISAVMMPQWIGRGLFVAISCVNVAAVAISLTVSFLVIRRLGIPGVILATVLSYGTTAVASTVLAIRCELEYRRAVAAAAA